MSSPAAQPDAANPGTAGPVAPSPALAGKVGSPRSDEPRGALAVAIREALASKDPALARRQAEAKRQYMKTHSPYSFQRDSSDKFVTKQSVSSRADLAVSRQVTKRPADQLSLEASSRRQDTMHARLDGAHASLTERERQLHERTVQLDALQSQLEATAEVLQIRMTAGSISGGTAASGRDNTEQQNEIDALRALVVQYRAERDHARADCKHAERRLRALEAERAAMGRVLENIRPGLLSEADSEPDSEQTERQLAHDAVPLLEDAPAAGQTAGPSAGRGGASASAASEQQHPHRGGGPPVGAPSSSSPSPGSSPSQRLHSSRMARSIGSRTSASSPLALAQGMRVRGSSQTASVLSGVAGTGTATPGRGTGARGPSLPVQSPSQMLAAGRAGQRSTRSSTTPSQAGVPRRRVVRVSLRVGPGNRLKSVGRLHRLLEKRLHRQVVGLRWGDVSLDDRGVALAATGLPLDKEVELAVVVLRAGPGASQGKVAKEVIGEESPTESVQAPGQARVADSPKRVAADMQDDEEAGGIKQRKEQDDEAHKVGRGGDTGHAAGRQGAGDVVGNKPSQGGASDRETQSAASGHHVSDSPAQEKATSAPVGADSAVANARTAMKPSQVLLAGASPSAAQTGVSPQAGIGSPAKPAVAPGTGGASGASSPDDRQPLPAIATHGHSASTSSMSGTPYLPTAGPGSAAMPPSPSSHTPVSLPPPRLLVAFPSDHDTVRGLLQEREGSSEATGVLHRRAAEAGHIRSPSKAEVAQAKHLFEGEGSGRSAEDLAWSPIGLVIGEKRPAWMQKPTPVSDEVKQRVAQDAGERRVGLGHIFGRMRKLARPRPLVDHVHSAVRYWGLPTKGPKAESTQNSTAVLLLMELQAVPKRQGASQPTLPIQHTSEVGPSAEGGNGNATGPASATAPLLTPSALLASSPPSTRGQGQAEGGQIGTIAPSSGVARVAGEQGGSGSGTGAASSDDASQALPVAGAPAVVLEEIVDSGNGRGGEQEAGGEAGAGQGIQLRSSRASPQRQGRLDVTPQAWGLLAKGGTGAQ